MGKLSLPSVLLMDHGKIALELFGGIVFLIWSSTVIERCTLGMELVPFHTGLNPLKYAIANGSFE